MGLLDGKRIVVTGVLTDASLAFGVASLALEQGAQVVLTGAGRALSLTTRTARKLSQTVEVLELDVTVPEHGEIVRLHLREKWGKVDGVVSETISWRRLGKMSLQQCISVPTL